MKNPILKFLPSAWVQKYRQISYSKERSAFFGSPAEEVFKKIYDRNFWGSSESVSGDGSELGKTRHIVAEISKVVKDLNIKSILDIPCGDFNWMQGVNLDGVQYTGADIVPDLIEKNKRKHVSDNIHFRVLNLITEPLPKCDLVFTRDCLVHLSYANIFSSLRNVKSSGSKYFLTTTFPLHKYNFDIATGDWRPINLLLPPFNFPEPEFTIDEHFRDGTGEYDDKALAIWRTENIPDL